MDPIFKTKCGKGYLILYPTQVALENKTFGITQSEKLQINQVTGVKIQTVMAPILLSPGASTVTVFSRGDQKLIAPFVKCKEALKFEEELNKLLTVQPDYK